MVIFKRVEIFDFFFFWKIWDDESIMTNGCKKSSSRFDNYNLLCPQNSLAMKVGSSNNNDSEWYDNSPTFQVH